MANLDKDITPVMGPTIDEKAFAPVDCHKCQAATKTEKHVDGVRGKCSTDAILCWEITVRNGRNIHSCLVVFTGKNEDFPASYVRLPDIHMGKISM